MEIVVAAPLESKMTNKDVKNGKFNVVDFGQRTQKPTRTSYLEYLLTMSHASRVLHASAGCQVEI